MAGKLVIDNAALEKVLKGPDGPVTRAMIKKTARFQAAARRQVNSKSGCLKASILWRVSGDGTIRVISDTAPCSPTHKSYSLFVHEGTKAHVIEGKNGKLLRFKWANGPEGDKIYFFRKVNHPGTKPNRFLTDNLIVYKTE